MVILPDSKKEVDINGDIGDGFSIFAARELAEVFALNGISSIRYKPKSDETISVEQHVEAIKGILSKENVSGKIILMSHGHNIGTLLRIYGQFDVDGVIATCPSIIFTNKYALEDFKKLVAEKKTLFLSIKKDPLVNCKRVDSIEGFKPDNITYKCYKDVHYTLRESIGIGRWSRKPVQVVDESVMLSKVVSKDIIDWINEIGA